ncbi:MAG: vitamin K epoxide reductase family protein [Candidatus Woesearchaeota archaeon]|nr:vitamin K epoxide reductase family protein [Candidatus Woesearchaeota archaeon]
MEKALVAVAFVGIIISLYAIPLHYGADSICNIGETFNCDKVNQSVYSVFLGVPVAVWGLLSYFAVFFVGVKRKMVQRLLSFTRKDIYQYLLSFVVVMLLFQLYLTAMEIFVIHAYCIVCLTSQACTLLLLGIAWRLYSRA